MTDAALGRFFSPAAVAADAPPVAVGAPHAARDRSDRLRRLLRGGARSRSDVAARRHPHADARDQRRPRSNRCPGTATAGCCPTAIPGAQAVRLPAAHISNLERPRSFTAALFDFLLPKAAGTVEAGMPIRRAALGAAHVDRSIAGGHRLHTRLPGTDHPIRVGHDLGPPRPRPSHAAPAGPCHDCGAGPLGGVPAARPRRPRPRARAVRREGSAAAGRCLRRRAGGEHRHFTSPPRNCRMGQWGDSMGCDWHFFVCFAGPHPRETLWGPTHSCQRSLRSRR